MDRPEELPVRSRAAEPVTTERRRLASPLAWERAVLRMLRAGLTMEQISRLADLRVRVRRGAYAGDGGTWPGPPLDPRRLEFARWLVQTGRLRES
jgi:hypothetical protein